MEVERHANWLDPLRLLFAAFVLLSHAPELVDGDRHRELLSRLFGTASFGELAVSGFLILSGYLIASAWERAGSPLDYLRNRLLRIAPGYAVAFAFALLIAGAVAAPEPGAYYRNLNWRQLAQDFLTLFTPTGGATFPNPHFSSLNGAMWSIQLEFACYLIAPFITRSRPVLAAAWIVAAVLAVVEPGRWTSGVLMFLSGAAYWRFGIQPMRWPLIVAAIGLAVLMFSPSLWPLGLATGGAYLLLAFGLQRTPLRGWVDVSYGVYLYGWPVQALLILWGLNNPWLLFPASLGIALLFGAASWYLIEKPALSFRSRRAYAPTSHAVPQRSPAAYNG